MRVLLKDRSGRIIRVIEGSPSEVVYEFAKAIGAREKSRRDLISP